MTKLEFNLNPRQKKEKSLSIRARIFLALFALVMLSTTTSIAGPHKVLIPKIELNETEFDLGTVGEGVEVRHTFKVSNAGEKTLHIRDISSTCGCTIPHMKSRKIAPGASADLLVVMDTSMKQGLVSKAIEIRSNDPLNHVSTIYLKAKVISPHADIGTGAERTAKIFTGTCARCHVEKGVGLVGEDLFFADCSMCHGYRAKGVPGIAPALIPLDYHNKIISSAMRNIIAKGSKTHRSMPGYAKDSGGPLDEKQIDSLIEYLRWRSDIELKAQKKLDEQKNTTKTN